MCRVLRSLLESTSLVVSQALPVFFFFPPSSPGHSHAINYLKRHSNISLLFSAYPFIQKYLFWVYQVLLVGFWFGAHQLTKHTPMFQKLSVFWEKLIEKQTLKCSAMTVITSMSDCCGHLNTSKWGKSSVSNVISHIPCIVFFFNNYKKTKLIIEYNINLKKHRTAS